MDKDWIYIRNKLEHSWRRLVDDVNEFTGDEVKRRTARANLLEAVTLAVSDNQ